MMSRRSGLDEYPLMNNISELISYVQVENPSVDQLCQFAVLRTFSFLKATALFGSTLESDGIIKPIGQFGFSHEVMQSWSQSSIDEDIPTADALKTNNIVWLADKSEWELSYPHLPEYENDITANSFVAWPISVRGSYMSVLGICLGQSVPPTPTLISFFETVGGIFAIQLSQTMNKQVTPSQEHIHALKNLFTKRQREVLTLVADGYTNLEIGQELGFSESTVRQETMRIYEILGATGRSEAIAIYRSIMR